MIDRIYPLSYIASQAQTRPMGKYLCSCLTLAPANPPLALITTLLDYSKVKREGVFSLGHLLSGSIRIHY